MRRILSLIVTLAIFSVLSGCGDSDSPVKSASRKPDVVDDAYNLCKAMEGTGLTTECSVHGFDQTVDVTIDTNGNEARKICTGVANQMTKMTANFAGQWKLRIFSPYSGNKPIATCTLH